MDLPAIEHLDGRRIEIRPAGACLRITLDDARSYFDASATCLFPVSDPAHYISLRDGGGGEIGMLRDPRALDEESRTALAQVLERRYVVPVITRVRDAVERFGTVDWTVETDRGARRFTTRNVRENALNPAPGRYVLADESGNRYEIRDIGRLDAASQVHILQHL
jgi:hypothetical protein